MKRSSFVLLFACLFVLSFSACSTSEEAPTEAREVETVQEPLDVSFAEQLAGTYTGHCCEYNRTEDTHSTYELVNEVTLPGDNSTDLLIDGVIYFHVSGRDISNDVITYRTVEGYGGEVTFRKNATILGKNFEIDEVNESTSTRCETHRDNVGG